MMAGNALMATGLQVPTIDAVGAFEKGQNAAQTAQDNQITLATKGMQNIGAIALGIMGGKLDGAVDPERMSQALDLFQKQGVDVSSLRDRPDMVPVIARASLSTLDQLKLAQSDADAQMAMKKFEFEVQKAHNEQASKDNWTDLTDPAQRAAHGIDPKDKGMYQINGGNGEIKPIGGKGQTINVGGNNDIGTIPPNYEVKRDADGNVTGMAPIPGSPAADAAAATTKTDANKKATTESNADIVTTDITRALDTIANDPNWTTGMGAAVTGFQPGSDAHSVQGFIDTVKANASIDKLQQIRNSSPTGASLGNISDTEDKMLADTIGKLDPTQKQDVLEFNLKRVFNTYKDIVDGKGAGPRYDLKADGAPLMDGGKPVAKVDKTTPAATPAPAAAATPGAVIPWDDPSLEWGKPN